MLPIASIAPDFELYATPDQQVRLSALRGERVILAFYPAERNPSCGGQLTLYREMEKYFAWHHAKLICISVNNRWSHVAFREYHQFHFLLLSGLGRKGAVAKLYDVYDEKTGVCRRALYALDEYGIICWSYLSPVGMQPGADGLLIALEQLNHLQSQEQYS